MQSKTRFFDGRIYRSTLSRFWLTGIGYAVLWVYMIFTGCRDAVQGYYYEEAGVHLLRLGLRGGAITCLVAGVTMAGLVYGWLFNIRDTAFAAGLPVRRETVFLSDMAAGFTILEGACAAAVIACSCMGGLLGITLADTMRWLAVVTLLHILYFGFASFCSVLTGNIFILPAVTAVFLYAAVALESSMRTIAQFLIFGLTGKSWKLTVLSPGYYLRNFTDNLIQTDWMDVIYDGTGVYRAAKLTSFTGMRILLCYAAAGAAAALLAVALLRRRPMEAAGETVAVPFLKKLFPWCAAPAGALTLGLAALKEIFGFTGFYTVTGSFPRVMALLVIMLIGALIGWFGAYGLMRKTVRVFDRNWGGFSVIAAVIAFLILGTELDLFGVERATVDPADVGYVTVWDTYAGIYEVQFTEPENIAASVDLQKKILANKALYESAAPLRMDIPGSVLRIEFFDRSGRSMLLREYVAPTGATCWSSCGDTYASWGNASSGNVPSGSKNPALEDLQDLINTPEAIRQRIYPQRIPASVTTVTGGNCWRAVDYEEVESIAFSAQEAWEVYSQCVLPDMEEGTLGWLQLCPSYDTSSVGDAVLLWISFYRGYGANEEYDGVSIRVQPDAWRTNEWLADHGMTIPGWERVQNAEELPTETVYDLPPLDGLAALLENLKLEYDADTAGTVVSVRWARQMLEWYSRSGEDPFTAYEDAKSYGWNYYTGSDVLPEKLERLREAGLQLVSGGLGLIREPGFRNTGWTEDTVNDLFDAVEAGLRYAAY